MRKRTIGVLAILLFFLATMPGHLPVKGFTPDKIAYVKDNAIWVMDSDGTGDHQVSTPGPDEMDFYPSWSPDGSKIAFSRLIETSSSRMGIADYGIESAIWVVNTDGTNPVQVTHPPEYQGDAWPTWSPDGLRIAFERGSMAVAVNMAGGVAMESAIWVVNADGTNLDWVTDPPEFTYDSMPAWSPDGTRIALVRWEMVGSQGGAMPFGGGPSIWVVNTDKTNPHQVSTPEAGGDSEPAWSPGGTKIAYTHGGLFTASLPGETLADVRQTPPIEETIWVMDANGDNEHQVSTPEDGIDNHPAWSPDGKRIAFQRGIFDLDHASGISAIIPFTIWVMDADGADEHQVSPGYGWSPDWWGPGSWGEQRAREPSLLPTAQYHIFKGNDLLRQANDLLSEAKTKGADTAQCEKGISEAKELLDKSKSVLTNPVYANNCAFQAIDKLKKAIECLKALLG